jgi:hypothetical protein
MNSVTGGFTDPALAQAQWDALASIHATSPFATESTSGPDVAGAFDSLIDTTAASTTGASADAAQLAILRRVQDAETSTIDLFA